MSPLSAPILGAAALVASPALWSSVVDGTMPLDVALTRYLIAIGICWAVISVVVELAFPTPGAVKAELRLAESVAEEQEKPDGER